MITATGLTAQIANSFFPCYALDSVGASMCCQGGQCQKDGLCNQTISTDPVMTDYWRGSCSDSTWQDPACFPIAPWITHGQAQLTNCQDGTVCPRSAENDNQSCCSDGLGQVPANGDITVPLAVIQAIQASALPTSLAPSTSSPVSTMSVVGISGNTSVLTVASTAVSASTTITVIETSMLVAATPSQSGTSNPQAQTSPPRNLRLPLGLGLGLAMPLLIGIGVLLYCVRTRVRSGKLPIKQEQHDDFKLVEVRVHELEEVPRTEMDTAVGRAGRAELSSGNNEETRGMLELDGS